VDDPGDNRSARNPAKDYEHTKLEIPA